MILGHRENRFLCPNLFRRNLYPPNSNSYSSSKNKEEYTYTYYFTSEGYDVSCEELTFGGVPYPIKPRESKLDFQSIPTSLDKQAIYDQIYKLSVTYDWDVDHYGEDCIVAHTNPSFWGMTWGEQIFVVFDKGRVWVNSVNDLNKRTSICSFGHNKRNIRRIREALAGAAGQEGIINTQRKW